ncbi:Imm50 family immunity protein [Streptomyces sp. NPDC004050]
MADPIDWPELRTLYGTPVPDLSTCLFLYLHIDGRDTSVTFGFETQQLPQHPKPEWAEKAYNALRFWIEFTGVADLRLRGIQAEAERSVQIAGGDTPGSLHLSVRSSTRSIAFTAAASRLSHTRVYLQGPV